MGNQRPKMMDVDGHPRAARLAGRGGAQGTPRRLRHRVRLCRHGLPALRIPAAGMESPHRRLRRQRRKSRALRARAARGDAARRWPASARWRCASASRSCAAARASTPLRSARGGGAAGRRAGPVGRQAGFLARPIARPRASPPKAATSRSSTSSRRSPRKPVVGVGRFTSPDAMVVADPARRARPHRRARGPRSPIRSCRSKIDEGREQDIRECIGCNICISSWHDSVPVRCTQNPTIGEEWRRGWHPERIAPAASDASILIVGAGPAGLECALALGRRGYEVTVAEAGGGDRRPAALRDAPAGTGRLGAGARLAPRPAGAARPTSAIYRGNLLSASEILELGNTHVVIATGSRWARLLYSPLEVPAGTPGGPARVHPRRHRRRRPARSARSWYTTSTTTTWAACSPSTWRAA